MAKTTRLGGASNKLADQPETGEAEDLPEEFEEAGDNYDQWTNDDLRAELEQRDLPTSGVKAELVARLREHDEAEAVG